MRIFLMILSIIIATSKLSSYQSNDNGHLVDITVTRLTSDNFQRLTGITFPFKMEANKKAFSHDWFIIFYSPNCPHCRKALPQWNGFSKSVISGRKTSNQRVKIGAVDCKQNYDICEKFNVEGYPTFLYLSTDYRKHEYDGDRTQSSFLAYINQQNFDPAKSFYEQTQISNFRKFFNKFTRTSTLIILILMILVCMLVYAIVQPTDVSEKKYKQYTDNVQFDGQQQSMLKAKW